MTKTTRASGEAVGEPRMTSMKHTLNRSALAPSEKRATTLKALSRVLDTALAELSLSAWAVDVSFVSDRAMQKLNREHRGKHKPTDVLSFPSYDGKDGRLVVQT